MFRQLTRRITVAEHLAAKARLDAPPKFIMIDLGDGALPFLTGTVDLEDYTRRDGHVVCLKGQDRYGWPKGHPDSPERLGEA